MGKHSQRITIFSLLVVMLIAVSLYKPTNLQDTQEKQKEQIVKTLVSSIIVEESARFHPLLRSGTYSPLDDVSLEGVKAYIVVNSSDGRVYSAKDATTRLAPASLTKLMTAIIALDVSDPSAKLMTSGAAALQEPTHLGVKPGEIFTIDELIPAMIMVSANDAAKIIGEETLRQYGGDEQVFITLMNKKSELLGLGETHFSNTQGFDSPTQYTNAYDLVRIARYAYEHYPIIKQAAATPYATIEKNLDHGFYHLPNWNALLGTYPGVDGLKIGYTADAGYSTAVTATRDGVSVIVIVLGADSIIERDLAAATLLNYAYEQEGKRGVEISQSLIQPRLDEWRELRENIFEELGIETIEEYNQIQNEKLKGIELNLEK